MKMENDNNTNDDRIMYLQQRKKALTLLLQEKNELLRRLCLQEADITGVIPSEMPEEVTDTPTDSNYMNDSNVNLTLRRKVETGFKLSENLLSSGVSNEDDEVRKLLLEKQVQTSIAEAALNMAKNFSNNNAVRRKHKHMYKQSQEKLAGINEILSKRLSQVPKSSSLDLDLHSPSAEENFNHSIKASPVIRHNGLQSTSNRYSEFIPDNYYLQHAADQNSGSLKDMNKFHYGQGDVRYLIQNNEPQILYNQDNMVPHNYYTNNKPNIQIQNKYRKKPRPPIDDYSVKRDHLSLSNYNIDNQNTGYVDQLHNQISDYRNTIASDSFFTYPRKEHYQNHFDEPINHNSEFYYEQNSSHKNIIQNKTKPPYNINHQSERNLFGSLDRRKINVSPMLTDNIRPNQKIKNSNRSHSIGELKMAEDVTDNISVGSHNSGNTLKEKQWHETSLDEQPLSPVKVRPQRSKTISNQYDIQVNTNYNDHFRSPVHSKYNYDYVDPQYLQNTLPNQKNSLYEKNFSYQEPPRPPSKQLPPVIPQTQMVIAKPAMPSPTKYHEENRDIVPKSPSRDNQINHILPLKSNNEPTKQFLSPKTVPVESPKNIEVVSPGTWCPYKEVSKPFEMSDFYKYSTKFRNRQVDNNINKTTSTPMQPNISTEIKTQYSEQIDNNIDPVQKGVYQPLRPLKCQPFLIQNHNAETG